MVYDMVGCFGLSKKRNNYRGVYRMALKNTFVHDLVLEL